MGDWGVTPLEHAIELENFEVIESLIKYGADVHFGVNDFLLNIAVKTSRIDILNLLIDSGADINLKRECGHTALMVAACCGSIDVVRFLVERGADVNAVREDGQSALTCAALFGKADVFDYLLTLVSSAMKQTLINVSAEGNFIPISKHSDEPLF
ncbi:MAG: ankyrin repeat domain-containing protein [Cyanothece sp. SIO2G6]|nr:ankyrin repeat domain-containing protein [Cyanothece sp. SIO2G6]